jgi:hypothetical protein
VINFNQPKINNLSRQIADKNNRGLDVSNRLYRPKKQSNSHRNTREQLHVLTNEYDMHDVGLMRTEKPLANTVKDSK